MVSEDLDKRSADIEKKMMDAYKRPKIAIRLDILRRIADDIDADKTLQEIFGSPVSEKIAVYAEMNDLRIGDAKKAEISEEQERTLLAELEKIIEKRAQEAQ
ncbi:MAG: hypothetical protein GF416_02760 [Candidatus Altiarchaeales archaeon]|nr:hypothetical protein [Candidatus Altiarchaeales archaeon]MBD3416040.1 hypothetical protein [Candidatus Altiarchaeales archaeon]